jgi:hypothetical protein
MQLYLHLNKYPKESLTDLEIKHAKGHKNIYKKFGFFQSEKEIYKHVAEKTGLTKLLQLKNIYGIVIRFLFL